jgi:large conductance mechanosensitive channel
MSGFRKFLMRGNLIDLAVAVVIGVAFNAIVQALVADIINPLIAAVAHTPNFSALTFHIHGSVFKYGLFLNALVSFAVIAAVVYYLIVSPMARFISIADRKKEAATRECPECLSEIPIGARRCMYCTAQVAAPPAEAPRVPHARHGRPDPAAGH